MRSSDILMPCHLPCPLAAVVSSPCPPGFALKLGTNARHPSPLLGAPSLLPVLPKPSPPRSLPVRSRSGVPPRLGSPSPIPPAARHGVIAAKKALMPHDGRAGPSQQQVTRAPAALRGCSTANRGSRRLAKESYSVRGCVGRKEHQKTELRDILTKV